MSPIDGLRCVVCRSSELDFSDDAVCCRACGQEYPVLGGVPVMFEAVTVEAAGSGPAVDDGVARQVLAAFELPDDPLSRLRLRLLMRRQVRFGGSLIQVESRQFLHRVQSSGHALDLEGERDAPGDEAAEGLRDLSSVPRYRWAKDYMPRRILRGDAFLANMRLENTGAVPLHRAGLGRCMVAQRWQRRDGTAVAATDPRTVLPIDIQPGQAVTVAVRIEPPAEPGRYRLTLLLVQEQVRWLEDGALTVAVVVEAEAPWAAPAGWVVRSDGAATDYHTDHVAGRALLAEWLRDHAPARPRVLEVGGNAVPMVSRLGMELGPDLVNVDVDLLGLQVGGMVARHGGVPIHHLCADAFDLPFASGFFDAIVIFASLHHFPDPAALLGQLRRTLRPGGFIGVFCEPVGHVWPGAVTPAFLAELERGVNEQSFSLREYALMFQRAELHPAALRVDFDSLKVRLVHQSAVGEGR